MLQNYAFYMIKFRQNNRVSSRNIFPRLDICHNPQERGCDGQLIVSAHRHSHDVRATIIISQTCPSLWRRVITSSYYCPIPRILMRHIANC